MSVSWTLYDTGSHGTWLCYFINNHPEHAKANLNITLHPKKLYDNVDDVLTTGKITEYGVLPEVNGCMWIMVFHTFHKVKSSISTVSRGA